jgi:predicted metal-dependent enzyme (double-stranded beta helix superfamily)
MASEALVRTRREAIDRLVERVEGRLSRDGVTRQSLAEIEQALESLARQESLFDTADFPPPTGTDGMALYELYRAPDDGTTLYLNVLRPGDGTRPHDHTTWAVIACVKGDETNRVYARVDDGSVPGRAALELVRTVRVSPGTPIGFMPEDIHSIHGHGTDFIRHLHLYGRPLDRLSGRVGYDLETGTVVPYNMNFMNPAIVCVGTVAPSART